MSSGISYNFLVSEFEKTKIELNEADTMIRRLTGRDPDEVSNGGVAGPAKDRSQGTFPPSALGRAFSGRKRPAPYPSRKSSRDRISSYDEESPDDEVSPHKKPALVTTVVAAKSREGKTRKATIEELNANSNVKARLHKVILPLQNSQGMNCSTNCMEWTSKKKEEYAKQRMDEMRLKNEKVKERYAEVENDRLEAERKNSSVTTAAKKKKRKNYIPIPTFLTYPNTIPLGKKNPEKTPAKSANLESKGIVKWPERCPTGIVCIDLTEDDFMEKESVPIKSGNKYAGGNSYCVQPTPDWQKPTTNFFSKNGSQEESAEGNDPKEDIATCSSEDAPGCSKAIPYEDCSEVIYELTDESLSDGGS